MLSIVVPTFNERNNIPILADKLKSILESHRCDYEIIFVDDNSPDHTWELAREMSLADEHIRIIRRVGRKGLSSAVIEGFLASKGDYLAVIDADLQHDPEQIPQMVNELDKGDCDLVIASRYIDNGSVGDWNKLRILISEIATSMSQLVMKYRSTDPMSGFFILKRDVIDRNIEKLSGKGFKILLDIMSVDDTLQIKEIPYTFSTRLHGESKLGNDVIVQYMEFLLERTFGKYVGIQYIKYMIVGSLGALLHFSLLSFFYKTLEHTYSKSLMAAILIAILFNYSFNNLWTFRSHRLKNLSLVTGYFKYNLLCVVGALANYSVSMYLLGYVDWVLASFIGAFVGANWNYLTNSIYTWKTKHE
ncbi:glycosyltransferase family 2 protein [Methanolobus psychrotolerans]|uniref:glycosyltransferase family 2 protein n=1 Tax=Methanolobus psychrotolerans TaxID=1874706 RepID=UPI0013EB8F78|nr:glycosyltransferase family 2 protein [Methanolobus psychrotolerans]